MTSVSRHLAYFLLSSRFIAIFLNAYPTFVGKSYVSPGYGPQLLCDDFPLIPGYKSSDRENTGGAPGAMVWRIIITSGRRSGV